MGLPKIIHYCWFGGNRIPEKAVRCIESWRKYCPDWEIREWNEQNYDVQKIPYIRDAYKEEKWAFVSDYARLDVVWQYGGIYLDTDVELIRSLDSFIKQEAFFAIEKENLCINTGLGFGAAAKNEILGELMALYENLLFYKEDGSLNLTPCPKYITDFFGERGYQPKDNTQFCGVATIYGSEYFCPMNFKTGVLDITGNTYGIHWYDSSWLSESNRKINDMERKIRKKYSKIIAKFLCLVYRNAYRFVEYLGEGILIEKIKKKWNRIWK